MHIVRNKIGWQDRRLGGSIKKLLWFKMPELDIRSLSVGVDGKKILSDIDLTIGERQVFVLFGPNGSGKSTLLKAIMGISGYNILSGEIRFGGTVLNGLPIDQRARLGIGMMFQHPPAVRGVKLSQVAKILCSDEKKIRRYVEMLNLEYLFDRDLNVGFSGGEIKRAELLQILLMEPKLILLDEPESGVDIENISVMGKALNEYLKESGASCFVITHTGYIIEYIATTNGCLMLNGRLYCVGDPHKLFQTIRDYGYERCKECTVRHAE